MTATYVPGTLETDPKKLVMSLQVIGPSLDTANTNIAANTANIATNTANIATNTAAISAITGSPIHASLGADVSITSTNTFFDGPSIAQGTTGTWFVSGTVTVTDTAGAAFMSAKLWDGTTIIASAEIRIDGAGFTKPVSLSGYLASPAGNLRISVSDATSTNGKILFNQSGLSKDSTISAFRIA